MNTTLWVQVDDADNARAESYWLYLTDANGGAAGAYGDHGTTPIIQMTGRYVDRFRRTPTGWKLASRTIHQGVN